MDNIKELYRKGLTPVNITVDDKETISGHGLSMGYSSISEVNIPLLKNRRGYDH
jgi:hypothetical protein